MELRHATMEDARFLFDLRRDPDYAAASFRPPPDWEDHVRWLLRAVRSTWGKLLIIEEDGQPVGMVRVDGGEVSIAFVPAARGRGLGTAALLAVRALPGIAGRRLTARIKGGNTASIRAFEKAGFKPTLIHVEYVPE